MSPEQENIIKDKLLEFEVPFEDQYWEDFQKKAKKKGVVYMDANSNRGKYYAAAAIALLLISAVGLKQFVFNDADSSSNAISSISDNSSSVEDFTSQSNNNSNNQILNNENESDGLNNPAYAAKNNFSNNSSIENNNQSAIDNTSKTNKNQFNIGSKKDNNTNKGNKQRNKGISGLADNASFSNTANIKTSNISNPTSNNSGNSIDNNVSGENAINFFNSSQYSIGKSINTSSNPILADINDGNSGSILPSQLIEENYVMAKTASLEKVMFLPPSAQIDKSSVLENSDAEKWQKDKKRNRNWEVGLAAGIGLNIPITYSGITNDLFSNFKRRPNLTAGGYFRYQMNKRIGLETGFYYKSIDDNFTARFTLIDNVNLLEIDEATIINRLRTFEIPFGVNIRMSSWMELSTGVALSFVKPIDAFNHLEINNPLNNPNIADFQKLSSFKNYGIRRVDARVYAGLTFNVSPYVGFRMVVNQGLIDRTNNDYYSTNQYNVHTDYTFSTIFRLNPKVIK